VTFVKVVQIYFKPIQIGFLDVDFLPYFNDEPVTPFFENEVIRGLYNESDHEDSDYYGVVSYKFRNKHLKGGARVMQMMEADNHSSDVYSFFGNKQNMRSKNNTFQDRYHPNLLRIGELIVTKLFGKDINKIKADRIYYNHWIAKREVFDEYCRNMLLPVMDLMENDEEIKALCYEDAMYNGDTSHPEHLRVNKPMSAEQCVQAFGVPYYTHHTFVLERLPSIYFAIKGYSIKHI